MNMIAFKYALAGASLVTLISATTALADCTTSDYNFQFSNDTVKALSTVDAGGCHYEFSVEGTTLSKLSVAAKPKHGTLKQTGRFTFQYDPTKGFKGADAYAIKICEESGGCSTVNYAATVQ